MAKVSVIVPVYNTEKYLERCFDALVNQTLDDIEIIAINDGSTDNSLKLLNDYQTKYPGKIKVYTKENGGQAAARNMGIKLSIGEYIGFADSDDYVDVNMYECMYNLGISKNSDIVECHYHYIQETHNGRKELATRGVIKEHKDNKDMFINPQVSPWNKIYRRDILLKDGVDFPEGLIYEDTSFYIKTIPYIRKSAYIDEHFVYYFLRGNSTMNANKSRKVADIFAVLTDIISFYKKKNFYNEYKDELEYFCVKIIFCSSLSRIGRVKDKKLRKELINKSFDFVNTYFPQYKKNMYFSGKTGLYIKCINKVNADVTARILGKIMKG